MLVSNGEQFLFLLVSIYSKTEVKNFHLDGSHPDYLSLVKALRDTQVISFEANLESDTVLLLIVMICFWEGNGAQGRRSAANR